MTSTQGKINKIKTKINKTIDMVTCHQVNKYLNSEKFYKPIVETIRDAYEEKLLIESYKAFIIAIQPIKYEQKIKNTILDFTEKKSAEIEALLKTKKPGQVSGGKTTHNNRSVYEKSRNRRRTCKRLFVK
jgi:hypothetical protein